MEWDEELAVDSMATFSPQSSASKFCSTTGSLEVVLRNELVSLAALYCAAAAAVELLVAEMSAYLVQNAAMAELECIAFSGPSLGLLKTMQYRSHSAVPGESGLVL